MIPSILDALPPAVRCIVASTPLPRVRIQVRSRLPRRVVVRQPCVAQHGSLRRAGFLPTPTDPGVWIWTPTLH